MCLCFGVYVCIGVGISLGMGVVVNFYGFKCMVGFDTAICVEGTGEGMVVWCWGSVLVLQRERKKKKHLKLCPIVKPKIQKLYILLFVIQYIFLKQYMSMVLLDVWVTFEVI